LTASLNPTKIKAEWSAPTYVNGDAVTGYKVYVDDGLGGQFTLVFNGDNYPSTYEYNIFNLTCGL